MPHLLLAQRTSCSLSFSFFFRRNDISGSPSRGASTGVSPPRRAHSFKKKIFFIFYNIYLYITRAEASLKVAGKKGGVRGQERERKGGTEEREGRGGGGVGKSGTISVGNILL